jgi:hypothetical protein
LESILPKRVWSGIVASLGIALLVTSCGENTSMSTTQPIPTSESQITETPEQEATESQDYTWSQLLSRDAIQPIYEPEFVPAEQGDYVNDELVMGVTIGGEAKAYAVGMLNTREMVNDELGGKPILVTW